MPSDDRCCPCADWSHCDPDCDCQCSPSPDEDDYDPDSPWMWFDEPPRVTTIDPGRYL